MTRLLHKSVIIRCNLYRWKVAIVSLLNIFGFAVIFAGNNIILAYFGIAAASIASEWGEVTYLGYTSFFDR
jgi:hypothetical protein